MAGKVDERRPGLRIDPPGRSLVLHHPAMRQRPEVAATGCELVGEDLSESQPAVRIIAEGKAPAGGQSDQRA
jgi:hypothetical protein